MAIGRQAHEAATRASLTGAASRLVTVKTVTEETHEVCILCGGRGQESSLSSSGASTCRRCGGGGRVLTKAITIREEVRLDDLADAVAQRLTERVKSGSRL
jgi:DnaJ-class molecular chaperone